MKIDAADRIVENMFELRGNQPTWINRRKVVAEEIRRAIKAGVAKREREIIHLLDHIGAGLAIIAIVSEKKRKEKKEKSK